MVLMLGIGFGLLLLVGLVMAGLVMVDLARLITDRADQEDDLE